MYVSFKCSKENMKKSTQKLFLCIFVLTVLSCSTTTFCVFSNIYLCSIFCGFDTLDRLVDWWGAWERESGIVNMFVNRIKVGNTIFSLSKWSEKCLLCIETIKQHAFLRNIFHMKNLNEYLISLILNVIDVNVFRYIFLLAWFYHSQNLV